ncbi:MAG TPA: hypothetical protein VGO43_00230 [Pyrinomonadaceae bacterium]|jgi:hypothetical protein|nr:hypothetical protein [Pyrinomonadaceae bacterium]
MVTTDELRERLAANQEWLLVREEGKTFPLYSTEIEVREDGGKRHFGFLDEKGFHTWRLNDAVVHGTEIAIDVAGAFARSQETFRLVPRTPAAELAAEIELARLQLANEIARLIAGNFAGIKLGRVALNVDNGRLAQIEFDDGNRLPVAALADVTTRLTPEVILTHAILWLEKLGERKKKTVRKIWIICEKRQARAVQKLHGLLTDRGKGSIAVLSIDRKPDPPRLVELPSKKIRELWREKPPKLILPASHEPSHTAQKIIDLAPGNIDIVISRRGETLRFNGLPFARVRTMLGVEKAWFGTGRRQPYMLTDQSWEHLVELIETLTLNRSDTAPNKRHELYRTAPEAWLESILRGNIKLLDANLILSPIYNQFRSSNDKIDLLALRRDGRLVIIELKTQPDRTGVFQAADYWRKIELQRRRGLLSRANLFDGREIADKPALVYIAAPAWSFHRDFEFFARCLAPEIELWRFELHEAWRAQVRVLARQNYEGLTYR